MNAKRRGGFTLVEVVLALGLAAIALLAVLGAFGAGLGSLGDSQQTQEAAAVLHGILETRLATPTAQIASEPLPVLEVQALPLSGEEWVDATGHKGVTQGARFRLRYRVWADPGSLKNPTSRLLHLRVALSWPPQALPSPTRTVEVLTSTLVQL